ncbi:Non-ribosomal peptide synthetase [Halomicronema hongdechloris C2206]|uniref:Non-ribosomal peptide synthetase n=1 Tax=Halomicronema hongdechloris C2206 TaxID=1641165 RepID=A0A1Z3HS58_9CYAN|nr:alpha/beta fold hydrolase [Halomicronema hongdechloris]ASC73150.1 Non-ribosomal peptide synthetase [Halomicronema hongdechloris C2206]
MGLSEQSDSHAFSLSSEGAPIPDEVSRGQPEKPEHDFWQAIQAVMAAQNQAPPLAPVSRQQRLPLSFSQERLWFLEALRPGAHTITYGFQVRGNFDPHILEHSLAAVINRHEALRTAFRVVDGQPVQAIEAEVAVPLTQLDLRSVPAQDRQHQALQILQNAVNAPFDLTHAPLLRGIVLRLDEHTYILGLGIHHLVFDGHSEGIFWGDLGMAYQAIQTRQPLPWSPLPIQYADFALWQRRWLQDAILVPHLTYWQNQLAKCAPLQLPVDALTSNPVDYRAADQTLVLSSQLSSTISQVAAQLHTTPFTVLLAAFVATVHRYGGQEDVVVCTPVAGRNRPEIQSLVGYFNNIVPLRCDLSNFPSFKQLLICVKEVVLSALEHQDAPFQRLGELSGVTASALSRVLFALLDARQGQLQLPNATVYPLHLPKQTTDFDLSCFWQQRQDTFVARLEYRQSQFHSDTIATLLQTYEHCLDAIAQDLEQPIERLPIPPLASHIQPSTKLAPSALISPQTPLENHLLHLWTAVLNQPTLGVTDNFFDLGGTSLQALQLFSGIEEQFQVRLPLATLLQAPTIQQLARVLQRQDAAISWATLVPLQPHGDPPPFFCVHGLGGNVLYFRQLAQYLGPEYPVYGLQAQGLNGEDLPYDSIEAMAAAYIEVIRAVQPQGPYLLGGHSFGSMVAFEMAQQLWAQGLPVGLVAILDRQGPQSLASGSPSWRDRIAVKLSNLEQMDRHDQIAYLKKELSDKLAHFGGKFWPQHRPQASASPAQLTVNRIRRAHWKAL